jgi:hypothetical protein
MVTQSLILPMSRHDGWFLLEVRASFFDCQGDGFIV